VKFPVNLALSVGVRFAEAGTVCDAQAESAPALNSAIDARMYVTYLWPGMRLEQEEILIPCFLSSPIQSQRHEF
jgi:hypothetical protein